MASPNRWKEVAPIFQQLNETKVPWSERVKVIRQQFPHASTLDWKAVFDQDPAIMGRIVGDILKIDQAVPGRPGKRAPIDQGVAEQRLRQLTGNDYSVLPFAEAFTALVAGRSLRGVARQMGCSHTYVKRLMDGDTKPDSFIMEQAAKTFRKSPDYFCEWRAGFILGLLSAKLERSPDQSASLYKKMKDLS